MLLTLHHKLGFNKKLLDRIESSVRLIVKKCTTIDTFPELVTQEEYRNKCEGNNSFHVISWAQKHLRGKKFLRQLYIGGMYGTVGILYMIMKA